MQKVESCFIDRVPVGEVNETKWKRTQSNVNVELKLKRHLFSIFYYYFFFILRHALSHAHYRANYEFIINLPYFIILPFTTLIICELVWNGAMRSVGMHRLPPPHQDKLENMEFV